MWSSFDEHLDASAGGGGGSSIDAVMVDPGAVVNNYNRQSNSSRPAHVAPLSSVKNRHSSRRKSYVRKQAAEQERLKQLEQERLQAQEAAKEAKEQQK
ncbi:hypothetical protein LRM35_04015 [Klebsiella variicola subsp. variicola]|nr:hypothetical protein LRM35_04015 [Klebsiella variicola subsp. variicola]